MTDDFETKDSGTRREFDTGSVRDAATGKGRYDLVTPIGLERIAQLYERGAIKYDARNWEKGQPLTVFMDCAMRHLQKHLAGHRDEDHLAAAAWNVMAIMHMESEIKRGALPAELDDLPDFVSPVKLPEDKSPGSKTAFKVGDKVRVEDRDGDGHDGVISAIDGGSRYAVDFCAGSTFHFYGWQLTLIERGGS